MIGTLSCIALDCPDPTALAEFYRGVLGGEVDGAGDDWVDLVGPSTKLSFQEVVGHRPPRWTGDEHGAQQLHLDVLVTDLEAADAEVVALGATVLDTSHAPRWVVYADPAGHPFCLVTR